MPAAIPEVVTEVHSSVSIDRMAFGWWNTSLSPIGNDRSDDNHKQISQRVVRSLLDDLKIDCLALGEVTNTDLVALKNACDTPDLAVYDGTLKTGRLQFDTGIIYNRSRLAIADDMSFTSAHGARNFKIANRIDFVSVSDKSPFHVFVSHWPSRGIKEENILSRETIATRLKDQIRTVEQLSPNAAIIVIGDFNDEPFDKSLAWHMLATRDRQLAKTKEGYLYNPFWRRLGESKAYSLSASEEGAAGSCFFGGETGTRWRTFDQILFSPAFLGASEWHLNEEETLIIESDFLRALVRDHAVHFDHLPIVSVLERRS